MKRTEILTRIAEALERLTPSPPAAPDLHAADAFVWQPEDSSLLPVRDVSRVDLNLLRGIDQQRDTLLANTMQFARGGSANNVLLWGARGMGKSSLVKAAHAEANRQMPNALALVEIAREDIASLPVLLRILRGQSRRILILCDDLSFERQDDDYKALKSVLDGGIEGRPDNVLFYATSNRRHLMPREMVDNEQRTAISPGEATEEKVSLSDRFGLWIGFHHADQDTYLAIVEGYAAAAGLALSPETLRADALRWSIGRGARSGRVAAQFIADVMGRSNASRV